MSLFLLPSTSVCWEWILILVIIIYFHQNCIDDSIVFWHIKLTGKVFFLPLTDSFLYLSIILIMQLFFRDMPTLPCSIQFNHLLPCISGFWVFLSFCYTGRCTYIFSTLIWYISMSRLHLIYPVCIFFCICLSVFIPQ